LLAKTLDDEVQVTTPGGEVGFIVVAIDYPD
jgi:transcription elongation GreA/GreB family factor